MRLTLVWFFITVIGIVAGCSTSPVEEPEDPEIPEGAGVFSGKKGEISLTDFFSDEKPATTNKQQGQYSTDYNVDIPAIDEQSFEDFETFKAWRRAQEPGSANYQEYQDWRAYQQYLRYKAQPEPQEAPTQ